MDGSMVFGFVAWCVGLLVLVLFVWTDWPARLSERVKAAVTDKGVERCR
jgi:hypothetical protein